MNTYSLQGIGEFPPPVAAFCCCHFVPLPTDHPFFLFLRGKLYKYKEIKSLVEFYLGFPSITIPIINFPLWGLNAGLSLSVSLQ